MPLSFYNVLVLVTLLKAKVRLFVSDYILDEMAEVLVEDLKESARYAHLARRA